MSRRGDCWDNAVAKSFFASLKLELVHQVQWSTRAKDPRLFSNISSLSITAGAAIHLGYLSPVEFERCNYPRLAA
jgi:putative transposase